MAARVASTKPAIRRDVEEFIGGCLGDKGKKSSWFQRSRFSMMRFQGANLLNGATDAEIEDAIHFAKATAGWSTYVNGLQIDFEQFKSEINQSVDFAKAQMKKQMATAGK